MTKCHGKFLVATTTFFLDKRSLHNSHWTSLTHKKEKSMKTIYLAGGCFWGVQKYFDQFDGVQATEVGYANGPDAAPSEEREP